MSTSTDAVLFYGYHLTEDVEVSEEAYDTFLTDAPVQVGTHCSEECSMPYVYWAAFSITARRGYPEAINPVALARTDEIDTAAARKAIIAFAKQHGLPGPGEVINPDWPEDKASDLGWWLVSWWG